MDVNIDKYALILFLNLKYTINNRSFLLNKNISSEQFTKSNLELIILTNYLFSSIILGNFFKSEREKKN